MDSHAAQILYFAHQLMVNTDFANGFIQRLRSEVAFGSIFAIVRPRLPAFEYLEWALGVGSGARFDLRASGMPDRITGPEELEPWADHVPVAELCQRSVQSKSSETWTEIIADRYGVERDCVVLAMGASQAIMQACFSLIRPGDHVVVERPTYEVLHRIPELLGAHVSRLERKFEENWKVLPDRLAKLLTPRTKVVLLSNLHNPSGAVLDQQDLRRIGEMAARVGAMVFVDEVYLDYCFDAEGLLPWAPACLTIENGVSWSSTSKGFGFSALRAGWLVTRHPEALQALHRGSYYFQINVPVGSSLPATRVLQASARLGSRAEKTIRMGRAAVEGWLNRESRVKWCPPKEGAIGLLRLPDRIDDRNFCSHLRDRYDTQVVPGSFFEAPGFVRIGFTAAVEDIERGLASISLAIDDFLPSSRN